MSLPIAAFMDGFLIMAAIVVVVAALAYATSRRASRRVQRSVGSRPSPDGTRHDADFPQHERGDVGPG
jgi:hypothetical protein